MVSSLQSAGHLRENDYMRAAQWIMRGIDSLCNTIALVCLTPQVPMAALLSLVFFSVVARASPVPAVMELVDILDHGNDIAGLAVAIWTISMIMDRDVDRPLAGLGSFTAYQFLQHL